MEIHAGLGRHNWFGDIRSTPLPELADAWAVTLYPRFRDVVAASLSQQTSTRDSPITYWYASVQAAAERAADK